MPLASSTSCRFVSLKSIGVYRAVAEGDRALAGQRRRRAAARVAAEVEVHFRAVLVRHDEVGVVRVAGLRDLQSLAAAERDRAGCTVDRQHVVLQDRVVRAAVRQRHAGTGRARGRVVAQVDVREAGTLVRRGAEREARRAGERRAGVLEGREDLGAGQVDAELGVRADRDAVHVVVTAVGHTRRTADRLEAEGRGVGLHAAEQVVVAELAVRDVHQLVQELLELVADDLAIRRVERAVHALGDQRLRLGQEAGDVLQRRGRRFQVRTTAVDRRHVVAELAELLARAQALRRADHVVRGTQDLLAGGDVLLRQRELREVQVQARANEREGRRLSRSKVHGARSLDDLQQIVVDVVDDLDVAGGRLEVLLELDHLHEFLVDVDARHLLASELEVAHQVALDLA